MKIALIKPLYKTNDKQQNPITGQFHYYHKYLKILKTLFLIDYQNIYLSIILLKINMVLFPDQIQPYHY